MAGEDRHHSRPSLGIPQREEEEQYPEVQGEEVQVHHHQMRARRVSAYLPLSLYRSRRHYQKNYHCHSVMGRGGEPSLLNPFVEFFPLQ